MRGGRRRIPRPYGPPEPALLRGSGLRVVAACGMSPELRANTVDSILFMRAVLVVNPNATATTPRTRDVLAAALSSDLRVDTFETKGRGHAIELATQAVETGCDLVVAARRRRHRQRGRQRAAEQRSAPGPARPRRRSRREHQCLRPRARPAGERRRGDRPDPRGPRGRAQPPDRARQGRRALVHVLRRPRHRRRGGERVESKRAKGKRSTHALYVRSTVNRFFFATSRRRTRTAAVRARPDRAPRGVRRSGVQHRPVDLPRQRPGASVPRCQLRPRARRAGALPVVDPPALRVAGRFFAQGSRTRATSTRCCCTISPSCSSRHRRARCPSRSTATPLGDARALHLTVRAGGAARHLLTGVRTSAQRATTPAGSSQITASTPTSRTAAPATSSPSRPRHEPPRRARRHRGGVTRRSADVSVQLA